MLKRWSVEVWAGCPGHRKNSSEILQELKLSHRWVDAVDDRLVTLDNLNYRLLKFYDRWIEAPHRLTGTSTPRVRLGVGVDWSEIYLHWHVAEIIHVPSHGLLSTLTPKLQITANIIDLIRLVPIWITFVTGSEKSTLRFHWHWQVLAFKEHVNQCHDANY